MIRRNILPIVEYAASKYPIVTITGPRQSGKTTLCRQAFDKPRVSLETTDNRAFAEQDPKGFIETHRAGAIFDEVQRVPSLLSYLQEEVDDRPEHGRFVLTGSQNFGLLEAVTQSLAGRTAVLHLLPPSMDELCRFDNPPETLFDTLFVGAYPRIHDHQIDPSRWLADYVTTYVERDVRKALNVTDLRAFTTFMELCAGRSAQELNLSALGSDAGITHNTARSWLSVLEASFICCGLASWHRSLRKRVVKAPKLHFFDSGLLCFLLGIRDAEHLRRHSARGAIFETWVFSEIYKYFVHSGQRPRLFHYRDNTRLEVDLLIDRGTSIALVESKSAATVPQDFLTPLGKLQQVIKSADSNLLVELRLVYGGDVAQKRTGGARVIPWRLIAECQWTGEALLPPGLG